MEIPYRLETPEAIAEAESMNLLGIGDGYEHMLAAAKRFALEKPPALVKARPVATRAFLLPAEDIVRVENIPSQKPQGLEPILDFPRIEHAAPWLDDIAANRNLQEFMRSFPPAARKLCFMDPPPARATQMLESAIAVRKFLRREIICYSKAKKPKLLDMDQLRKLLAGYALFDMRNEDVQKALAAARAENDRPLYENAAAELLFARLPASIEELTVVNPKAIRRKVFAKIAQLPLRGLQKTNLHGQFPATAQYKDLVPTLHRVDRLSQRLNIPADTRRAFHDYLLSIADSIVRIHGLYGKLFLDRELAEMRKSYVPRTMMISATTRLVVLKGAEKRETLEFYPTKDYLDLFRGRISKDCVDPELSEKQLRIPAFFNVRIFRGGKWIGNIYMLDFSQPYGALIVDRIQIPRSTKAEYVRFFAELREVLAHLFADVNYEQILVPLAISNHGSVQKMYNSYRARLPKIRARFRHTTFGYFESLDRQSFHVLHRKNESGQKA